jgi:hypothetical protein
VPACKNGVFTNQYSGHLGEPTFSTESADTAGQNSTIVFQTTPLAGQDKFKPAGIFWQQSNRLFA